MDANNRIHVCPWWMGYALINPFRRCFHNPVKILSPFVRPGMTVMDYGSAMGYFSIPMARMTGDKGKVYCVDLQDKMLATLRRRAARHSVSDKIRPLQVGVDYNAADLQNTLDFVLLFYVVHEVPDKAGLFRDISSMLKTGGKVLFAEPKSHVTKEDFQRSVGLAQQAGLTVLDVKPDIKALAVTLQKT